MKLFSFQLGREVGRSDAPKTAWTEPWVHRNGVLSSLARSRGSVTKAMRRGNSKAVIKGSLLLMEAWPPEFYEIKLGLVKGVSLSSSFNSFLGKWP